MKYLGEFDSLDDLLAHFVLENNAPVEDFLGLTPTEIHELLYEPFGPNSPVRFRSEISGTTLDQIPIFRVAEEFLKIVAREGQLPLTPRGALQPKTVAELYNTRLLLDEHIEGGLRKLWYEEECMGLHSARLTTQLAGLVRKARNKLTLTRAATKLMEQGDRLQLFKQFFQAYVGKLFWGHNDGFPIAPVGQLGWAFSVILLDKFGDTPSTVDGCAEKYARAFPHMISFFHEDYATPERQLARCYGLRTFQRFFLWFGFVSVEQRRTYLDLDIDLYRRTTLVRDVFSIDE